MSDIKVGDLVMVVRWPHKCIDRITPGYVFTVQQLWGAPICCCVCEQEVDGPFAITADYVGVPVAWLKKIDPPAPSEPVSTDSEVTA